MPWSWNWWRRVMPAVLGSHGEGCAVARCAGGGARPARGPRIRICR
jgi:hypothetical protein